LKVALAILTGDGATHERVAGIICIGAALSTRGVRDTNVGTRNILLIGVHGRNNSVPNCAGVGCNEQHVPRNHRKHRDNRRHPEIKVALPDERRLVVGARRSFCFGHAYLTLHRRPGASIPLKVAMLNVGIVSLLLAPPALTKQYDNTGSNEDKEYSPTNKQNRRPIDRAGSRRNQVQGAKAKVQLTIFGGSRYRLPLTVFFISTVAASLWRQS